MTLSAKSEVRMLSLPRPTRRVIAPIVLLVLCFCAICGYLLLEARRSTYERAADVAKGLITAIEADIGRNIETADLSLQGAVDGLSLPEFDRFDPIVRNPHPVRSFGDSAPPQQALRARRRRQGPPRFQEPQPTAVA